MECERGQAERQERCERQQHDVVEQPAREEARHPVGPAVGCMRTGYEIAVAVAVILSPRRAQRSSRNSQPADSVSPDSARSVLVTCSYSVAAPQGRPATPEEQCDMEFQNVGKGRTNIKLFSAVIGGSAVVAMAAPGYGDRPAVRRRRGGEVVADDRRRDEHRDDAVGGACGRCGQAHDQGACAASVGGGGRQVGRFTVVHFGYPMRVGSPMTPQRIVR